MSKRQRRAKHLVGRGIFAVFLAVAGAVPVLAADAQLPAIVTPASTEHHRGKVIFVELVTSDLSAAKRFYGGLFGWEFRNIEFAGTSYAEASLDGRPVAGMIQRIVKPGERRQPAWLSFLSVNDVDAAKKTAVQSGAKVLFEPHDIPGRGREAVFADPQGAVFAVLNSVSGDPPEMLAEPGEWIWSSLITNDPDKDAAFYQALFDYEVFEVDDDDDHLMLASGNYARASANPLPSDRPNLHPHWLNFVRVDDAAKTAAKVKELGGRVFVEPRADRNGGMLAIVADPQGAPFGLLEWPDSDRKEVRQ